MQYIDRKVDDITNQMRNKYEGAIELLRRPNYHNNSNDLDNNLTTDGLLADMSKLGSSVNQLV